jgi:uncharacterized protein (DUF427 family)
MAKAMWNGAVLAESDETVVVEGNHYFPHASVNWDYFQENSYQTTCAWKGVASYYTVVVDGKENQNAAWYYPTPSPAAAQLNERVAFWSGVKVED